ncbi:MULTISPECIES: phage tail protein [Acinetobacter]|uniref:Phage tail collar domain-containing protein n=1 Tax=Acinetobacter higginsii TaxID=70347 RepID=N9RLE7_9GAMM|nr:MULTISPECIES: tail fiber protein [Acinetobacter]ENX58803.1 hypothetical protein F902_01430 [Acinetobacter higginsii]
MSIEKLTEFAKNVDSTGSNTEGLELEKGFPSKLQPARQWFNWLFNKVTKKVNELIDAHELSVTNLTNSINQIAQAHALDVNTINQRINQLILDHNLDVSSLTNRINSLFGINDDAIGLISICPFEAVPVNYLECNGQTYNKADYPKLAAKLGNKYGGDANTFVVPDYRSEFVRGWDHGRGVDVDRSLGSHQDDAMQNITGSLKAGPISSGNNQFVDELQADGAFEVIPGQKSYTGDAGTGSTQPWGVKFDASKVVRTALENRPRNITAMYVIKAK